MSGQATLATAVDGERGTGAALVFPGQGAQVVGMGRELAARSDAARAVFEQADAALGWPLSHACFEGPEERLTATDVAQPALLVHALATVAAAPDEPWGALCGHSLGEWTALVVAGVLDLADAARLVHQRGLWMQEACPRGVGAMAAVVGVEPDALEAACAEASEGDADLVVPATFNGRGQIVVSGHATAVARLRAGLGEQARVIDLNVSAPFHSPLMAPAQGPLADALAAVDLRAPVIPVCSSVDASWPSEPAAWRELLVAQLVEPVRWEACVRSVATREPASFAVAGAGSSLIRMLKRMRLGAPIRALDAEPPNV